ncbi:uncharacterized protein LOC141686971 [Apium graveolens]|uniref:uncharacterized protein LOC141686971 n=1 Tax=Apium graveolens TaxID=4045 RepID=UPI003D7AF372
MEGKYSLYSQGNSGWSSTRNEELQENDVWGVVGESKYINSRAGKSKDISTYNAPHGLPTAAKMIPRTQTSACNEPVTQICQQSAPLNIPDWSKIYGNKVSNKTTNKFLWLDHDDDNDDNDYHEFRRDNWESDEDDGEDNMIPPHEWIAKKLATSQISSFSVCEGAGRTLKGRDLRRVRNAILSKTGFLE